MTKSPSKPELWTGQDISEDGQGYLDAQATAEENAAEAIRKQNEADDREMFTKAFVEAGGKKADAAEAWQMKRNERAATAASRAETSAEDTTRRRARSVL